jgi:hypothetical protein
MPKGRTENVRHQRLRPFASGRRRRKLRLGGTPAKPTGLSPRVSCRGHHNVLRWLASSRIIAANSSVGQRPLTALDAAAAQIRAQRVCVRASTSSNAGYRRAR